MVMQSIAKVALTSLMSGVIVAILAALLTLHFNDKSLYEIILSRKKVLYFFFVLLILLVPVMFSLLQHTLLSLRILAVYVRELLVSVVIVVSFSVTWKILDDPASLRRPLETLYMATKRAMTFRPANAKGNAIPLASSVAFSTGQSEIELNDTFLALDRGDIELGTAKERLQFHALDKFMQGEDAGLYELREMVRYNGGLRPAVKVQLEHLRQAYPEKFTRLQLLLS